MNESATHVQKGEIKYLILGCGNLGYHIIQELFPEISKILVIDNNEDRVKELRDQKVNAMVRELDDPGLFTNLPSFSIAFILTGNNDLNRATVSKVRAQSPKSLIVVRTKDPINSSELEKDGTADLILYPQKVAAQTAVHQINKIYATRQSQKLFDMISKWHGTFGIIAHNNPDPDAISSALALSSIAHEANPEKLKCRLFYSGNIGHQENRTLVNLLEVKLEKLTPENIHECDYIALVDSPAPGLNNPLSPNTHVHIIIDHHENPTGTEFRAEFTDIRPGLGATASIFTQYMKELDISVEKKVATGLLYGIRSDTKDFKRNVTPDDLYNAAFLLPLTDLELLDEIMSPSVSQETLDVLGEAIRQKKIRSGYLFSNVGYIRDRDSLPQAADILINLEGVNTAIVYGITDQSIIMSVRNRDVRLHIGNVFQEAFGDIGDAGGHPNMAAATIPLSYFKLVRGKEELLGLIIEPLLRRFTDIIGLEEGETDEI